MTAPATAEAGPRRMPVVVGFCSAAAIAAWVALPPSPLSAVLLLVLNALAVVAIGLGVRTHQPAARGAWLVLLAAQACSFAAFVPWYLIPSVTGELLPFPSAADAMVLLLYAGNSTAVGLLLWRGRRRGGLKALLDVLMVTVSVGTLSWLFLMQPHVGHGEVTGLVGIVSLAYPAFDLLLFALALRLAFDGTRTTPAKALLIAWAVFQLSADTLYGVFVLEDRWSLDAPSFPLWMAAFGCLAAAALHPTMATLGLRQGDAIQRQTVSASGRGRLALVAVAGLVLPAVLVSRLVQGRMDDVVVVACASVLVFVLALARGHSRHPARPSRRQLLQLVAAFILCALLPLGLLAGASIRLSEQAVEGDARARVRTTATVTAELVHRQMEGLGQLVAAYAERQLLMTSLGDGSIETFDGAAVQRHLRQLLASDPGIAGVFVTDAEGRLADVLPLTPEIVGDDFSFRDWYTGATTTDGPYISEAYTTAIEGEARVVAAAVAVHDPETQDLLGILAVVYDLAAIQAFSEDLAEAQHVNLRITDQRGIVVAEPGADDNQLVDASGDAGVAAALQGRESVGTALDAQGEEILSAYASVPHLGWTVTAQVPTAVAYASLDRLNATVLVVTVLLGQVLLGGLVLIARAQRKNHEAEKEVRAARDEALAATRAKSEFLTVMSHELRTPLNGVMGMTSLLLETALSPQQRDYTETVRTSADSLLALLNDLLDLAKVEAQKLELEDADFDLDRVVEEVVLLMQGTAHEKGLVLDAHVDDGVRRALRGDAARLRQVLLNLVGNALKFTAAGSVRLRVMADPAAAAGPPTSVALRFEVVDTGIGIDPAARERLFEPFSQADASTTRQFGGTGLGLAICKRLVRLFGGEIGVDSAVGAGSTFWFTGRFAEGVPTVGEQVAGPVMVRRQADRPGLVLVVDDNRTNQAVALRMLERLGHRADVVSDGAEAVQACARVPYDLVLMDCQMPVMDGYDATRAIRAADGDGRRTPIVAMTASAMAEDHRRCYEAGMDAFLSKPVRLGELAEAVAQWLGELPERAAAAAADAPAAGGPDGPGLADLEVPVLSESVLDGLRSLGPTFLPSLVPVFVSGAPASMDAIRTAVRDADAAALANAAHALRGSAGNLGGLRVAAACRRLETAGKTGRLDQTASDLRSLEKEMTRMIDAVQALMHVSA